MLLNGLSLRGAVVAVGLLALSGGPAPARNICDARLAADGDGASTLFSAMVARSANQEVELVETNAHWRLTKVEDEPFGALTLGAKFWVVTTAPFRLAPDSLTVAFNGGERADCAGARAVLSVDGVQVADLPAQQGRGVCAPQAALQLRGREASDEARRYAGALLRGSLVSVRFINAEGRVLASGEWPVDPAARDAALDQVFAVAMQGAAAGARCATYDDESALQLLSRRAAQ
jgi:hypothetical protein